MSDVERPWDEGEKGATDSRKTGGGCLWPIIGFIGFFVAMTVAFVACTSGGSSSRAPTAIEARTQCEGWVKKQLKAPATAKFSGATETSTGVHAWTITGNVDAENSFGAMVRSTWTCEIRLDGDTWRGGVAVD